MVGALASPSVEVETAMTGTVRQTAGETLMMRMLVVVVMVMRVMTIMAEIVREPI